MSDKDNLHWTPGEPLPELPLHTISLRDYFAAHAPEGVPLHYTGPSNPEAKDYEKAIDLWAHHHTKVAYAWADAMLESRDKQPQGRGSGDA